MISAILILNQKGQVVISRFYRDDVNLASTEVFRNQVIAAKDVGAQAPIRMMDKSTFLYTRHGNLFFVAVTRSNINPAMTFQFLYQTITVFKGYFGEEFDEDIVKDNLPTMYELLDEIMDHGYPQNCALDVLRLYINLGSVREAAVGSEAGQLTSQITGTIDWRREGIRYRRNEVFIDVLESVNLLMSHSGNVLRSDATGKVMMKTFLTGMPECKLGLNDKLIMDRDSAVPSQARPSTANRNQAEAVRFDDCTFHRCVRLGKFDADRSITFIPPDGEFELMRYRITDNVNLPFRLIPALQEEGKSRMTINLKAIANFDSNLFATNVVIKIPCPPNTARCNITCPHGRANYEPGQAAIVWRLRRFTGGGERLLTADVELVTSTRNKPWGRPPISVDFQVPMFAASGLNVRFLKVYEKTAYKTTKWVRMITRAGQYQIRI